MLLKIFAAIGAGGSVLHTLIAGQTGNALETTGILLLRFLEYFFGAHIAYALVMLLSTELFIRKSKPQEKPSKFWLWHLHAVADLLCFYARADVSITGTELIPKDTRYLMVANHRSLADPVVMVHRMPKEELTFISKPGIVTHPASTNTKRFSFFNRNILNRIGRYLPSEPFSNTILSGKTDFP